MIAIEFVKAVGDFARGQVASVDEKSAEVLIKRKDAVLHQSDADAQPEDTTETKGEAPEVTTETEGQQK